MWANERKFLLEMLADKLKDLPSLYPKGTMITMMRVLGTYFHSKVILVHIFGPVFRKA